MRADGDDELVRLVQEHGKAVHDQDVSRADALAMAQPAD
jgi:predicted small metal-binding protein